MAARFLTGLWPRFGFWAIYPTAHLSSKLDALIVLAAGDGAVLVWWIFVFLLVRRRPERKSALVGPTLVLAVVLVNWIVAALLFPFGREDVGASDASKFLAISGCAPVGMAVVVIAIAGLVSAVIAPALCEQNTRGESL